MSDKLVEALKVFWRNLSLQSQAVIGLSGKGNCGIMELKEKKRKNNSRSLPATTQVCVLN